MKEHEIRPQALLNRYIELSAQDAEYCSGSGTLQSLANECRSKGFTVIEDIVENVTGYDNSADLVTCFEVLEHVDKSLGFVLVHSEPACPSGHVFFSTLGIDGFDLQKTSALGKI